MKPGDLVILNKRGEDYLKRKNRSFTVGVVYNSIRIHSAQVKKRDNEFVEVQLFDLDFSENLAQKNSFYIHCDHLQIKDLYL